MRSCCAIRGERHEGVAALALRSPSAGGCDSDDVGEDVTVDGVGDHCVEGRRRPAVGDRQGDRHGVVRRGGSGCERLEDRQGGDDDVERNPVRVDREPPTVTRAVSPGSSRRVLLATSATRVKSRSRVERVVWCCRGPTPPPCPRTRSSRLPDIRAAAATGTCPRPGEAGRRGSLIPKVDEPGREEIGDGHGPGGRSGSVTSSVNVVVSLIVTSLELVRSGRSSSATVDVRRADLSPTPARSGCGGVRRAADVGGGTRSLHTQRAGAELSCPAAREGLSTRARAVFVTAAPNDVASSSTTATG